MDNNKYTYIGKLKGPQALINNTIETAKKNSNIDITYCNGRIYAEKQYKEEAEKAIAYSLVSFQPI